MGFRVDSWGADIGFVRLSRRLEEAAASSRAPFARHTGPGERAFTPEEVSGRMSLPVGISSKTRVIHINEPLPNRPET